MSHMDRIPYNATSPDEQRPRRDNDSAGDDWMDANPHRDPRPSPEVWEQWRAQIREQLGPRRELPDDEWPAPRIERVEDDEADDEAEDLVAHWNREYAKFAPDSTERTK